MRRVRPVATVLAIVAIAVAGGAAYWQLGGASARKAFSVAFYIGGIVVIFFGFGSRGAQEWGWETERSHLLRLPLPSYNRPLARSVATVLAGVILIALGVIVDAFG